MEESIKVNGIRIICMAKEYRLGLMVGGILVNSGTTRSVALEYTNGQINEFMKVSGLKVDSKV